MKKRRHLTPKQICAQCNAIAREKRMAERTPWTAMGIMCAYILMKVEGFKGKRISKIINRVNEIEEQWRNGEIDLEELNRRLFDKCGFSFEPKVYDDNDIKEKKGSYRYWLQQKEIEPGNIINETAMRYYTFFYTALIEEYKLGNKKLKRIYDYNDNLLLEYEKDRTSLHEWEKELEEEAGLAIEMPIDPLTQTQGSIMTG